MTFNTDKCEVLHIGSNNKRTKYLMISIEIPKVNDEKDLGVTICSDFKPGEHCSVAVKTTNKLTIFISRTFKFKSEKVILTLFNALMHPHLEYCIQF